MPLDPKNIAEAALNGRLAKYVEEYNDENESQVSLADEPDQDEDGDWGIDIDGGMTHGYYRVIVMKG